jgi:hypothetical protein
VSESLVDDITRGIKQMFKKLSMFLVALMLVGCQTLGVPSPETLSQKIAVTVVTVTEVRKQAFDLLVVKKISPEDAKNIQSQADNVVAAAQVARTMAATDPVGADAKLQATRAALVALQAYLLSREGK